ncbi:MAG TPA: C4-dicarboxylate ABC transporter substrate-binding protein, partial [Thermovirga lienii]|nr:C4-dicarboxylate ABC transporter substrate-binding protein [Thermovirga lienii]
MSKGKMYLSIVVGFVVVFTLMAGAAFAAPEITLKFAGQSPSDHPATMLMNEIAKEGAEKSNGR